jgi:hypothetical protein
MSIAGYFGRSPLDLRVKAGELSKESRRESRRFLVKDCRWRRRRRCRHSLKSSTDLWEITIRCCGRIAGWIGRGRHEIHHSF